MLDGIKQELKKMKLREYLAIEKQLTINFIYAKLHKWPMCSPVLKDGDLVLFFFVLLYVVFKMCHYKLGFIMAIS